MGKHTVISPFPPACPHCIKAFGCNGALAVRAELGGVELPSCCKRRNTDLVQLLCKSLGSDVSCLIGLCSHIITSLKMQMKLGYSTSAGWRK